MVFRSIIAHVTRTAGGSATKDGGSSVAVAPPDVLWRRAIPRPIRPRSSSRM